MPLLSRIYYSKDLNTRTIAIQTAVDKDQACALVPAQSEVTFNFYVTNTGSYILNFIKERTPMVSTNLKK
jgi:hypothetical protein